MSVDDLIAALVVLPPATRALPVVIVPEGMPIEASDVLFLPSDGIVARGPCVVVRGRGDLCQFP